MNRWMKAILVGSAMLLMAEACWAHKVIVFGWVEGDTVFTESKFSGGNRVKGGTIEVFNQSHQKLLQGTTDDQGNFAFPRPRESGPLTIVLTAGMGHAGQWVIGGQELAGTRDGTPETGVSRDGAATKPLISQGSLSVSAIEAVVTRVVQKELAPLKAQRADRAWGFRDIMAGIGYILGLMGLASYLRYRNDADNSP